MYKDKEKQKEANRLAQARFKAKQKGITGNGQGITDTRLMTPNEASKHVRMTVMERLFYQPAHKLNLGEHNFVSLPGCACYGIYNY